MRRVQATFLRLMVSIDFGVYGVAVIVFDSSELASFTNIVLKDVQLPFSFSPMFITSIF